MTRVTFAYPRTVDGTEYQPDETADLDDIEAKQLIKDGFARPADKTARATSKTVAAGGRTEKGDS